MKTIQWMKMFAAPVALLLCTSHAAQSQGQAETVKYHVVDAQVESLQTAGSLSAYHVMAANVPGAKELANQLNVAGARGAELVAQDPTLVDAQIEEAQPQLSTPTGTYMYVGKMTAPATPSVIKSAVIHNIYLNMTSGTVTSNWGAPSTFLTNLGKSTFIHLTDQYTGLTTSGRYTVDTTAHMVTYKHTGMLLDSDIQNIVHGVAKSLKLSGMGHLYNVFIMKGTDLCFNSTDTQCYSPDNWSTFAFCAYHSAASFTDTGTILYSAEPYQNVDGCSVSTPTVNSVLIDSTNTVLSHETFEAISDALPGYGFTNQTGGVLNGDEIGDECEVSNSGGFNPPDITLNGYKYRVQLEYSNTYAACAQVP